MKKVLLFVCVCAFPMMLTAQYRWEVTGGLLFSEFKTDGFEADSDIGYQVNAAYEYLLDERARTGLVFSFEYLQRKSVLIPNVPLISNSTIESSQFGFSPKFRVYFSKEIRPYLTVGPSFRINSKLELDGVEIESGGDADMMEMDSALPRKAEGILIGGVYGAGLVVNIGERAFIMAEAGYMNDFTDNLENVDSKFSDIYVRIGFRYRPR